MLRQETNKGISVKSNKRVGRIYRQPFLETALPPGTLVRCVPSFKLRIARTAQTTPKGYRQTLQTLVPGACDRMAMTIGQKIAKVFKVIPGHGNDSDITLVE